MDASLERVLAEIAAELPGSTLVESARHLSLKVGGKVFAYTRGSDVVVKLPAPRVEQLAGTADARVLVMGERVMREWVVFSREDPRAFGDDLALFEEAMAFVGR